MMASDLNFYFDPVCPFAWMTSKWVRMVAQRRDYSVGWRFISLRMVNADVDYPTHFPAGYEDGHTAGLRLLRVAARVRAEYDNPTVGALYAAIGTRLFDTPSAEHLVPADQAARHILEPLLEQIGLPADTADALDDPGYDSQIRAETDEALTLTGRDVGTPILHFRPPEGVAFFGPVISRLPKPEDAEELWEHVVGLAGFPGFAELKRSLRERPQLAALGVVDDSVGIEEDWHGGSRRTRK
jgi:hypothetical protein